MQLPRYVDNLPVAKFKKFLVNCGGQLLHETNEYEVLRVQTDTGTLILYRKACGLLTWPQDLIKAYMAYKSGGRVKWRASKKKKVNRKRGPVLIRTLFARDGHECFFCGRELTVESATIEHLLNISNGGNNHINNLVLADNSCNQRARNMSIAEKVVFRDRLRSGTG